MSTWGLYDVLLGLFVVAQVTAVAYLYHPKWKALAFSFPIPFTLGTLALGQRVDATSVIGLTLILLFMHTVRLLYQRQSLPIVLAILCSALGYCLVGWALAKVVPRTDLAFFLACGGALALAGVLVRLPRHPDEPGHRTSLPIWVKLPIILAVVLFLVVVKQQLRGFMATFPMVGVLAAYEARHSLRTLCAQIPIMLLCMIPLMMVARFLEPRIGPEASLAIGWIPCLLILACFSRWLWNGRNGETELTQR
jgi:hypothetical protein